MANVKFYIPPMDFSWAGPGLLQACHRIGAAVTPIPFGATHGFAAADTGAMNVASQSEKHGFPFAPTRALGVLSDRLALADAGVPCIRSVPATSADAVAAAFDGPVFVKKRAPIGKQSGRWVYTHWSNTSDLIASADAAFWSGEYVVQDYLGAEVVGFDTTIAVNAAGEVLPVVNTKFKFSNPCTSNSASSDELPDPHVMSAIQAAVQALGVRGGIYGVQIAQVGAQQLVMDWNIRPGYSHVMYLMGWHKLFDRALAHVAGLPLPDPEPLHIENRHYQNAIHKADFAGSLGLIVRHDLIHKPGNTRVGLESNSLTLLAVGRSQAEVAEKIQSFERDL